ncbi:hypothetical protein [Geotalea sp. SG265]|uniref:hypothetical protein n=1 Tax=Geotalea sp. SG265 TaxID=2922867 RepID=UPI001FAEFD95|nr:hypothetical protein [Geotalea sp. SG265]
MSATDRPRHGFGAASLAWGALAVAGTALWLFSINTAAAPRGWRALLVNFLFFCSLAGGLTVWPAVVRACNGRWPERLERTALSAIVFAVPSLVALVLLWVGSSHWSPWYDVEYNQGGWLNNAFIFGRDLAGLAIFWLTAARYLISRRRGSGMLWGGILIAVYGIVFSLLGFDLVMALDPEWYSTLLGGYFFMSGLYIAIAAWAFLSVWQRQAREEQLLDMGRLIVAFSLMATYLMYAHLLPMWYENLPDEIRFLVPRLNFQPWLGVSYFLLAVVYLGPLVLLLTERSKCNRWSLGGISLLVLCGMWLERWWLVAPALREDFTFSLADLSAAMAFAGLLGVGMEQFQRRLPADYFRPDGEK